MKYFQKGKSQFTIRPFNGIAFTKKNKLLPLYLNAGKYKSCGISYTIEAEDDSKDYRGKVFLIYDIPSYIKPNEQNQALGIRKSNQYQGYGIRLKEFESLDDYLRLTLSSRTRKSIRSNIRKLERNFDLNYLWYTNRITTQDFSLVFKRFYELIDLKYKNVSFSHADPEVKGWYRSLFFKLINDGKAAFFIVKNKDEMIAISFLYLSDNMCFSAITGNSMDYQQFGLGNLLMVKKIEWAILNGYEYYDLGKGSYNYKQSWSNHIYDFEYHVLYDKSDLLSSIFGKMIYLFYEMKQKLRLLKHKVSPY